MSGLVFDLFAGARGWEAALDECELRTVGFEMDVDACAVARAAGLRTVRDDVARLVPGLVALVYGWPEGLIGSPPCQLFSAAGRGAGRRLMEELHRAVGDAARGASDIVMARHRRELRRLLRVHLRESNGYKRSRSSTHSRHDGKPCTRESSPVRRGDISTEADRMARNVSLVWQPARWVAALRPRWVALEQVPAVLPLWREMARGLEAHGYKTWCGILSSERFGVAQTRKRAILLASLDCQPQPPEATHQAYVSGEPARAGEPDLFGPGLLPWVSMATALGWGMTERPVMTVTAGSNRSGGPDPLDGGSGARKTLKRERERGAWLVAAGPHMRVSVSDNGSAKSVPRAAGSPAATVTGKHRSAEWLIDRPATTVNGDPRISEPGHHDPNVSGSQQANAVRVSVHEAAALQSFPPDWPWWACRSKTAAFQCIGNAIPPLMARRVLRAARGMPAKEGL